jgi:hypothetical protein
MVYGKGVSDFFHWDKRDYTFQYLPRNIPMPPDVVRLTSLMLCSTWAVSFPLHVPTAVIGSTSVLVDTPLTRREGTDTEACSVAGVSQVQDETVRTLIACLNEAMAAIEPWPLPGRPIAKE